MSSCLLRQKGNKNPDLALTLSSMYPGIRSALGRFSLKKGSFLYLGFRNLTWPGALGT